MDEARVEKEFEALAETFSSAALDLDEGVIVIQDFRWPDGWNRQVAPLIFDLPATYPAQQPAVYFQSDMRYRGERPKIMLKSKKPGFAKHCIRNFSDEWVPARHTVITIAEMVKKSLEHPNSSDPWKNYD